MIDFVSRHANLARVPLLADRGARQVPCMQTPSTIDELTRWVYMEKEVKALPRSEMILRMKDYESIINCLLVVSRKSIGPPRPP